MSKRGTVLREDPGAAGGEERERRSRGCPPAPGNDPERGPRCAATGTKDHIGPSADSPYTSTPRTAHLYQTSREPLIHAIQRRRQTRSGQIHLPRLWNRPRPRREHRHPPPVPPLHRERVPERVRRPPHETTRFFRYRPAALRIPPATTKPNPLSLT